MVKLGGITESAIHLLAGGIKHGLISLRSFLEVTDRVAKRTLELRLCVGGNPLELSVELSGFPNDARKFFRTQNHQSQDHQEEDLASREIKHLVSLNLDPSGSA